ncbi:ICOSL protein, partial [Polypterus senegalus]
MSIGLSETDMDCPDGVLPETWKKALQLVKGLLMALLDIIVYRNQKKEYQGCEIDHPSKTSYTCLSEPDSTYHVGRFQKILKIFHKPWFKRLAMKVLGFYNIFLPFHKTRVVIEKSVDELENTFSIDEAIMQSFYEMDEHSYSVTHRLTNEFYNTCSLCKPDGISFNSKCYFISTDKLTWHESRDWCETWGGRLVNIESSHVLATQRVLWPGPRKSSLASPFPGGIFLVRARHRGNVSRDHQLFYTGPNRQYIRLVVMSEEQKRAVLMECHDNPGTGNHNGVRGTRNTAIAGYFWPTLTNNVANWVRCCHRCQLNDPIKTMVPFLHSIKILKNIEKAQTRQQRSYGNRKRKLVKTCTVNIGDSVLVSENPKKQCLKPSLASRHQGPFTVSSISSKGVATVLKDDGKHHQLNVSRLRPYYSLERKDIHVVDMYVVPTWKTKNVDPLVGFPVSVEREIEENEKSFTDLIHCIEDARKKLVGRIREHENQQIEKAEGVIEQLEKEMEELKKRDAELQELSEMSDDIHFLQNFTSLCVPPADGDSLHFNINANFFSEDLRKELSDLKTSLEKVSQWDVVTWTPSADECLTASIGKTVQIPCFVKTNESLKAENISVEWTTSEGLIIHSFVTGKDDLTNQDSRFKGRTQLFSSGVSRGDLSLSLLNVSVDDEGTFKCSYYDSSIGDDNSRDLSKHCLQVADHYSVPIVYGPPAGLNKSEVNFTCKSMGGHPEPKVRWSVNNKPLEDSRRVTTTPSRDSRGRYNVTSVLTVNVTRDVSVTCTVENERLREQRTSAEIQCEFTLYESHRAKNNPPKSGV